MNEHTPHCPYSGAVITLAVVLVVVVVVEVDVGLVEVVVIRKQFEKSKPTVSLPISSTRKSRTFVFIYTCPASRTY